MRSLVVLLFLFGIGLSVAGTAPAQLRAVSPESELSVGRQLGPSYERVVLGTTLGGVLGGAAGLAIVAITREPGDAVMFPTDLLAGTVLGSTAGMYLGARLSSGRQGNPWLTGVAAVGGTALGLVAGFVVGDQLARAETGKAPEILGTALGIAIPVGLTSFVEWRAAR